MKAIFVSVKDGQELHLEWLDIDVPLPFVRRFFNRRLDWVEYRSRDPSLYEKHEYRFQNKLYLVYTWYLLDRRRPEIEKAIQTFIFDTQQTTGVER